MGGRGGWPRRLAKSLYHAANTALDRLEVGRAGRPQPPFAEGPLLILGPPRSGTTALYQYLAASFEFCALTNTHCLFFGAPSYVEQLVGGALRRPSTDLESRYGRTRGLCGVSECGNYWERFIPAEPHHASVGEVGPRNLTRMRSAVQRLAAVTDRPLLFKNVFFALRLGPIHAALPECRFLVLHRDLTDNAVSILEARRRVHGSVEAWFSARPPGRDLDAMPPAGQAVEQIRRIHAEISAMEAHVGSERFLHTGYEELIGRPSQVADRVEAFLASHGTDLKRRAQAPPDPRGATTPNRELRDDVVSWMREHPADD